MQFLHRCVCGYTESVLLSVNVLMTRKSQQCVSNSGESCKRLSVGLFRQQININAHKVEDLGRSMKNFQITFYQGVSHR